MMTTLTRVSSLHDREEWMSVAEEEEKKEEVVVGVPVVEVAGLRRRL